MIVPRYLKRERWITAALAFLAIAVFVFYGRVFWFVQMSHFEWTVFTDPPMAKLQKNVIRDYAVIALATCIYLLADWRARQKETEQLMKAKAEAELKLLKGQLQPHFLFNTLNNIYSLALTGSDLTADAILKLTELLDYLVYRANRNTVQLGKEVGLIENYLDLEALRHGDSLQISKDIRLGDAEVEVAPLLMLPLVENCFKHGGRGEDGIFRVEIAIGYSTGRLEMVVKNTVHRVEKEHKGPGGVGLENLGQRLEMLYPDRHNLKTYLEDDLFVTKLQLVMT